MKEMMKKLKCALVYLLVLTLCVGMFDFSTFISRAEDISTEKEVVSEGTESSQTTEPSEETTEPTEETTGPTEETTEPTEETTKPTEETTEPTEETTEPSEETIPDEKAAAAADLLSRIETALAAIPGEDSLTGAKEEAEALDAQSSLLAGLLTECSDYADIPEIANAQESLAQAIESLTALKNLSAQKLKENTVLDLLSRIEAMETELAAIPTKDSLQGTAAELEALNELGTRLMDLYEECDAYKDDERVAAAQARLAEAITGLQELMGLAAEMLESELDGSEENPWLVNDETSLENAVKSGGHIQLTGSFTLKERLDVASDVYLDLKEQTLTLAQTTPGVLVSAGTLQIKGGDSGNIVSRSTQGIKIKSTGSNATLILNSGTISAQDISKAMAVVVHGNSAAFTMNGGTIANAPTAVQAQLGATFNMKGGTINATGTAVAGVWEATLSINSGSISTIGKGASYAAISANASNVTIKEGATIQGDYAVALLNFTNVGETKSSTLTMTGGTVTATTQGICGNNQTSAGSTAKITGGTIEAKGTTAIYWPMDGTLSISSDAKITGGTGIEAKAGTINITGGTISGTGEAKDEAPVNGGSSPEGSAILLATQMYTPGLKADIENVTLNSTNGYGVRVYNTGKNTETANITIDESVSVTAPSGRVAYVVPENLTNKCTTLNVDNAPVYSENTYSVTDSNGSAGNACKKTYYASVEDAIDKADNLFVAANASVGVNSFKEETVLTVAKDVTLTLTGESRSILVTENNDGTKTYKLATADNAAATIGNIAYATLKEAITAAGSTKTTISLIRENLAESITIPANANIVLDLNGKTLTGTTTGTGIQNVITNSGTLTIQDSSDPSTGTVTGGKVKGDGIAVVNNEGATCTIASGTIKRQDNNTFGNYTVKNMGTMYITGGLITNNSNTSSLVINFGDRIGGQKNWNNGYKSIMVISGGTLKQNLANALKNDPGTTLTIKDNAKIERAGDENNSLAVNFYGNVTMEGGSITTNGIIPSLTYKDVAYGQSPGGTEYPGNFKITGGTLTCGELRAWNSSNVSNAGAIEISGTAKITAPTVRTLAGNSTVSNGKGAEFKITGGTFSANVSSYLSPGYKQAFDTGEVLVSSNNLNVRGKNDYAAIGNIYYTSLQNAINAAKPDDTVKYLGSIAYPQPIVIQGKNNITIDGGNPNGGSFRLVAATNSAKSQFGTTNAHVLKIENSSNITIKNLSVEGQNGGNTSKNNGHAINVYCSDNVTLENVTAKNAGKAGLVVNASSVEAIGNLTLTGNGWGSVINVGSGITGKGSSLDASGATLNGVDLIYADEIDVTNAGGKDSFQITLPSDWCRKGSANSVVYVKKNTVEFVASGKDGYYTNLQDALNEGGTVELLKDHAESVVIPKGTTVTLDLKDFTLTGTDSTILTNNGTVTIQNGTIGEAAQQPKMVRMFFNRSARATTPNVSGLVVNKSQMTMNEVNISAPAGNTAVVNGAGANMNVFGSTITATEGTAVENSGSFTATKATTLEAVKVTETATMTRLFNATADDITVAYATGNNAKSILELFSSEVTSITFPKEQVSTGQQKPVVTITGGTTVTQAISDAGNAEITIKSDSKAEVAVASGTPVTAKLELSKSSLALKLGQTQRLTATANGKTVPKDNIAWATDNSQVAAVSTGGVITPIGEGTATITATANVTIADAPMTLTATCVVTVAGKVTSSSGSSSSSSDEPTQAPATEEQAPAAPAADPAPAVAPDQAAVQHQAVAPDQAAVQHQAAAPDQAPQADQVQHPDQAAPEKITLADPEDQAKLNEGRKEEEITDDSVPLANARAKNNVMMFLWMCLAAISAAGLSILAFMFRKHK